MRHGIIAGTYTSAGSAVTVTPTVATVAAGTLLTGAAVQTAMGANTAVFDAGGFGSAIFSGSDFAAPFRVHAATDGFIEAIYRKQIGSDAHLVAWLALRVWSGGQVEALPWIENGYIRVASPTSKSATYTFTMGGTQREALAIDLPARCRTPLVSSTRLSHWLGADPGVVVRHDVAYLMATRLVPYYGATVAEASALVTGQPGTFTPLQQGGYPTTMNSAGYSPHIGLLPQWDTLYLTSTAPSLWATVQRQAYSAGRYPIHYRDENTNRPLRFSQFPNLSVNNSSTGDYPATASGTAAPGSWELSHSPSVGFMAYLLTGRLYHLETLQFAATYNYLFQVDSSVFANRNLSQGLLMTHAGANTVRGAAWGLRTLAQAATITPDADPPPGGSGNSLRTEFINSLTSNVNYYHGKHVAQASSPFGHVQGYSDFSGGGDSKYFERSWMQDFFVASMGYAKALAPPLASGDRTKLDDFFTYTAKSVVGRFGTVAGADFLYRDAAAYDIQIAASDTPDWTTGTGPWPASWGEIYANTIVWNGGTVDKTLGDGSLRGTSGSAPTGATGYWGNLLPALSYAVEHGAADADEAWARLTGASNFSGISGGFSAAPEWAVLPPQLQRAVPAAGTFSNISANTAQSVVPAGFPNTEGAGPFYNWAGGVNARHFGLHGGIAVYGSGHLGLGNPVLSCVLVFDKASLRWTVRNASPTPVIDPGTGTTGYNSFGESQDPATLGHPYTPHTYHGLIYQSRNNGGGVNGKMWRNWLAGAPFANSKCGHVFDLSSASAAPVRAYDNVAQASAPGNTYPCCGLDEKLGGFWILAGNGAGPIKFIRFSDSQQTTFNGVEFNNYGDYQLIVVRDLLGRSYLVGIGRADSGGVSFGVYVAPLTGSTPGAFVRVTPTGTAPPDGRCGAAWCEHLQCLVIYAGNNSTTVFKLVPSSAGASVPSSWDWQTVSMAGNAGATPTRHTTNTGDYRGAWGRFLYDPVRKTFFWSDSMVGAVQEWNVG